MKNLIRFYKNNETQFAGLFMILFIIIFFIVWTVGSKLYYGQF